MGCDDNYNEKKKKKEGTEKEEEQERKQKVFRLLESLTSMQCFYKMFSSFRRLFKASHS